MIDHIADLAAAAGATLPAPLPKQELLNFTLLQNGNMQVTLVGGDSFVVVDDDAGEYVGAAQLLRHLLPMTPGREIKANTTYVRRELIANASGRRTVFLEAGR